MMNWNDLSRRAFIQSAIAYGCFSSKGAGASTAIKDASSNTMQLSADRSIFKIKGDVWVDDKKADLLTRVTPSSSVKTGSNSYVIFAIGRDAHILRENSALTFRKSKMVTVNNDSENWMADSLRLLTGKLLSVFGERSNEKPYQLITTTATIGIRGTGVYVEAADDHSYLCTCYGVVEVQSNTDATSREIIAAKHHDAPRLIVQGAQQGKQIQSAGFRNHTDEELMLIESLVGRVTPFSKIDGYKSPRKGY